MEGKYCIEISKSGRAGCKRCKAPIAKDTLRIGTKGMFNGEHETFSWTHVHCFKLPKATTVDEFLVDLTGFHDLEAARQQEVHQLMTNAEAEAGTKRVAEAADAKAAKAHKKSFASSASSSSSSSITENEEVYEKYKSMNLDELKDYLRWNNQLLKGTKPELVKKCVDGELYGAIPPCPEMGCKGKLTPDYELGIVSCSGAFNEELGTRVKCYFKANLNDIHRVPWRTSPPTEAEKEARLAAASGTQDISVAGLENLFDGIADVTSQEGRKAAVALLIKEARKRGIKLPKEDSEANIRVGGILLMGDTTSPGDIVQLLAKTFGTESATRTQRVESTMGTVNAANEGIIMALSELAQKYLADGNVQASGVYRKAIAAIRGLPYQVTEGKALTRAKSKVPGIGKKIADMIDQFLATGSMDPSSASAFVESTKTTKTKSKDKESGSSSKSSKKSSEKKKKSSASTTKGSGKGVINLDSDDEEDEDEEEDNDEDDYEEDDD